MSYYTVSGIISRGLPILLFTSLIGLVSGQMLNARLDSLVALPTILLLIPALIKIGGDTGSMLGARLSSAFHMGLGTKHLYRNPVVRNSVLAALIVGFSASLFLSLVVWAVCWLVRKPLEYMVLFKICTISGFIELIVVFSATVIIASTSHRFGIDPDDTVIPIIATIGDLVGIMAILTTLHMLSII